MNARITFDCPYCQQPVTARYDETRSLRCPHCRQPVRVPTAPTRQRSDDQSLRSLAFVALAVVAFAPLAAFAVWLAQSVAAKVR